MFMSWSQHWVHQWAKISDRFMCCIEYGNIISTQAFQVQTWAFSSGVHCVPKKSSNLCQLSSNRAQSICLYHGFQPELFPDTGHRHNLLEEQHMFVSFVRRPPSCGGWDYDMTSLAVICCSIPSTVLNCRTQWEFIDQDRNTAEEQRRQTIYKE